MLMLPFPLRFSWDGFFLPVDNLFRDMMLLFAAEPTIGVLRRTARVTALVKNGTYRRVGGALGEFPAPVINTLGLLRKYASAESAPVCNNRRLNVERGGGCPGDRADLDAPNIHTGQRQSPCQGQPARNGA